MLNRKQSFLDITVSSSFCPFPRVTLHAVLCPIVLSEITVCSLRDEVITVVVSILWRLIYCFWWCLQQLARREEEESIILRATDDTLGSSTRVWNCCCSRRQKLLLNFLESCISSRRVWLASPCHLSYMHSSHICTSNVAFQLLLWITLSSSSYWNANTDKWRPREASPDARTGLALQRQSSKPQIKSLMCGFIHWLICIQVTLNESFEASNRERLIKCLDHLVSESLRRVPTPSPSMLHALLNCSYPPSTSWPHIHLPYLILMRVSA